MTENKAEKVLGCHLAVSQFSAPEGIQKTGPMFLKLLGDGERRRVGEVDDSV